MNAQVPIPTAIKRGILITQFKFARSIYLFATILPIALSSRATMK
jgi:hypothetical protein